VQDPIKVIVEKTRYQYSWGFYNQNNRSSPKVIQAELIVATTGLGVCMASPTGRFFITKTLRSSIHVDHQQGFSLYRIDMNAVRK
jgi:hypothetical protein